jgi:hypothetical protein
MVGSERSAALQFEIAENLQLVDASLALTDKIYQPKPTHLQHIVFVPFHTDVW